MQQRTMRGSGTAGISPPPVSRHRRSERIISDTEALQLERQHAIERRRKWLAQAAAKGAIYTITELGSEPIEQRGAPLPGYKIFLRPIKSKKVSETLMIHVFVDSIAIPRSGDTIAVHNPARTGDTLRLSELILVERAAQ